MKILTLENDGEFGARSPAGDRDNPELVEYGEDPGPGFLALMRVIIGQAAKEGRQADVSICREMAGNPSILPALIQLGYRSFSVSPGTPSRSADPLPAAF